MPFPNYCGVLPTFSGGFLGLPTRRLSRALWTPAQLGASLDLWLDAEDTNTITLNGTTISQWDDKSGNARHASQATATDQPTYLCFFGRHPLPISTRPDSRASPESFWQEARQISL